MSTRATIRPSTPAATTRLRVALCVGASIWLLLVLVGFFAPGGWTWGMPGPIGHIENFMISLWIATLVVVPLLAARDGPRRDGLMQAYLLGILALVVSTLRGEPPMWLSDGPPLLAAAISAGLALWAHPNPRALFTL